MPIGVSVQFTDVSRQRRLQEEVQRASQELETALEELQSTNEELETTNEELQSTVEELETTNEELQSTNEELETMNEELQSTNEELQTINDEARERGDELGELNAFLESILTSLRSAVAVVDRDLHIRKWSRRAEDMWGLRQDEALHKNFLNLDIGLPVDRLQGADPRLPGARVRVPRRDPGRHQPSRPASAGARDMHPAGNRRGRPGPRRDSLDGRGGVNAEDFARRLEDMRRHVEDDSGDVRRLQRRVRGAPRRGRGAARRRGGAAPAERGADRGARRRGRGAPPLPAPLPVRAGRLPADRSQRHHPGSQPLGRAPARACSPGSWWARRWSPSWPSRIAPRLRGEIGRWQSEPAAKSIELRLQPRGGQPFDASLTLSVARGGPRDKAFGFRWLVRDISAHRQLTQELRLREETARREAEASEAHAYHVQKLESIGVLAGGIAHDFNNLLHVVLGNADLARLHVPADSPAREHLDEVVRATQRAAELTQQLLAYSGRGAVESRQLDLSREVREMATLLRTAISKQATLKWDLAPELPASHRRSHPAPADRDEPHHQRLRRPRRGVRHDHAAHRRRSRDAERPPRPPASVFLEVSDTGCGMDSGTLQRIFDPFFSTKFTGRGLGLAAVMGIVESHQGHVRIRTAPGEGTTFRVVLPAVAGEADVAPRRLSGAGWRGRGTVLVVEDEEGVREVVGRMLERLGFHVITAVDGQDAIRVLDEHDGEVTAVLLDLSMPRMGGPETVRLLRQRSPELPVVLMSGYTEQDVASKILDGLGGAVGFLHKPFLSEDLSGVLRQISQSAIA